MIRTYIPLNGKLCHAVDGPNGSWLVTPRRQMGRDLYDVWKSDRLRNDGSPGNLTAALRLACTKAGCDTSEIAAFLAQDGAE